MSFILELTEPMIENERSTLATKYQHNLINFTKLQNAKDDSSLISSLKRILKKLKKRDYKFSEIELRQFTNSLIEKRNISMTPNYQEEKKQLIQEIFTTNYQLKEHETPVVNPQISTIPVNLDVNFYLFEE